MSMFWAGVMLSCAVVNGMIGKWWLAVFCFAVFILHVVMHYHA